MSNPQIDDVLLIFKEVPVVTSDSKKFKCISYYEFQRRKEYSTAGKIWLFMRNTDPYDGTYLEMNIVPHSKLVKKVLDYLEIKGYHLGKYDSVGERRYQVIEGLVENKNPEYFEIHLETSKAEEIAKSIVNFISQEKGRIHISTRRKRA